MKRGKLAEPVRQVGEGGAHNFYRSSKTACGVSMESQWTGCEVHIRVRVSGSEAASATVDECNKRAEQARQSMWDEQSESRPHHSIAVRLSS